MGRGHRAALGGITGLPQRHRRERGACEQSETYRAIRNTLRYQLSNLYDFDPAKHSVPDDKLTGLDRWILGEFSKLEKEVCEAYDRFEFHVVYQKVSQFIAVELSAVYHDVIKDRLYTEPANSHRRRSTQTALLRLVRGLCQALAPMLVFTADEAWEYVPGKSGASVHEVKWEPAAFTVFGEETANWKGLFELRNSVLPELEKSRQTKTIGKSLEAKVTISVAPQTSTEIAEKLRDDFRELINVSQLNFTRSPGLPVCAVARADGQKCERCWRWELDTGKYPEHPTLCGRCVEAVRQFQATSTVR
jgi:isoleucyl-tRNA synthetase